MTTIPCNCSPFCRQSAYVIGETIIECSGIRHGDKKLWLGSKSHQSRILRKLAERDGKWTNAVQLIDAVFGDDPTGGPLCAYGSVSSSRRRLKTAIAEANIPLEIIGQHGKGYKLVERVSDNAEAA